MQTLVTARSPWFKLYTANTDAAAITPTAPTATKPSGDGVVDLTAREHVPNCLLLAFAGERSAGDNETFSARIELIRPVISGTSVLWLATPAAVLTGTLGTAKGVAGGALTDAEYLADTLAASWISDAAEVLSPQDNSCAWLKLDAVGASLVRVHLAKATCAKVNALAGWY